MREAARISGWGEIRKRPGCLLHSVRNLDPSILAGLALICSNRSTSAWCKPVHQKLAQESSGQSAVGFAKKAERKAITNRWRFALSWAASPMLCRSRTMAAGRFLPTRDNSTPFRRDQLSRFHWQPLRSAARSRAPNLAPLHCGSSDGHRSIR